MPKLTQKAARELQSSFKGRITSSHDALAEFPGRPRILIPESVEDVERALRLAKAANRRVFVRSGRSLSTVDVTKTALVPRVSAVAKGKPAAAVLSLEEFQDVDVSDGRVTVGAAATTGNVAKKLAKKNLFLPLDDNPTQSIVSAVLSMGASPFLRSGAGSGPLRDSVVEAEVVPTEGVGAGRAKTVRNKGLHNVLAGDRRAVITKLVLDGDVSKTIESERWVRVWTASYDRKTFAKLCTALFGGGGNKIPEQVDLSVRVTSAAYSMKLVIVRVSGTGDATAVEQVVQAAFKSASLAVLESREVAGPGASIATWVATGPNEAASGEILYRFGSNAAPRPFAKVRPEFLAAVDFLLGVSPRTKRERAPRVRGWAELQLTPEGKVVVRAQMSAGDADAKVAKEARDRMAKAIGPDRGPTPSSIARAAIVRRALPRTALRGIEVLPRLIAPRDFDLPLSNRTGEETIPGFKGNLYDKSAGHSYRDAIKQYAVSSYPREVVKARMTPKFVAVAKDSSDVVLAVNFASQRGLKVVTRSGGHQYCGLSSGGSDTLLIDMSLFTKIEFSGGTKKDPPAFVTVGPGVALNKVSKELRDEHVVIPHGECPLVNLGGHVQTGGIGHQLRSLGATLDWVRSFKMVTRDPQSPAGTNLYAEREFTRPSAKGGNGPPTDDDLFRAVLGGGPSSWGVLTEITFELLADSEHLDSAGFSYPYLSSFGSTKEGFRAAMEHFRKWAERESSNQLPRGIDLFLSVISGDFPRPPVLLVETMCTRKSGLREIKAVVKSVDAAVPNLTRLAAHASSSVNGETPLSVIADEGVRVIGMTGLPKSGREFDLPYKKSLHITKIPFSEAFRDRFVDLVTDVQDASGLKVVFQGVIGGGSFVANAARDASHMQRRDALVQLVFDVFYEDGYRHDADRFQRSMKDLLQEFSGGLDARMLWGSFEDEGAGGTQINMNLNTTQAFYYDSPAEYARLQQIKANADPKDIFHTSFTVQ